MKPQKSPSQKILQGSSANFDETDNPYLIKVVSESKEKRQVS